jgi:hypothetical protein
LKGGIETLQLQNVEHIRQVLRDFENHGIVGRNKDEWNQDRRKLKEKLGNLERQRKALLESADDFVDECEIIEFGAYKPPPTAKQVERYDVKNHKYIKQSSHKQVILAEDGKTPLYMNEGECWKKLLRGAGVLTS